VIRLSITDLQLIEMIRLLRGLNGYASRTGGRRRSAGDLAELEP
jgi:hypothetical protein